MKCGAQISHILNFNIFSNLKVNHHVQSLKLFLTILVSVETADIAEADARTADADATTAEAERVPTPKDVSNQVTTDSSLNLTEKVKVTEKVIEKVTDKKSVDKKATNDEDEIDDVEPDAEGTEGEYLWDLKFRSPAFEIPTNCSHSGKKHLKYGQKCSEFEWSGF